ncbi:MAG: hypothetical protein R3E86_20555 [Pseudomonadales bacterium]
MTLPRGSYDVVQSEEPVESGYLVYIEPGAAEPVTDDARQRLAERGIDTYVMAGGPAAGGVSVGVFSSRQRAERQRQRVADLGYPVAVRPLREPRRVYHLLARVAPGFPAPGGTSQPCADIAQAL